MVNKYFQKNKEKFRKEAHKKHQNLSEEEKEKRPAKDIEILLKKKEKKGVSIIRNVSRSYLRIEEIIINT